jgi:hypothetical protein
MSATTLDNFSPEDRKAVLEMIAANIAREVVLQGGHDLAELVLLPMSVAEKMLSMDARTIKKYMEWVEITPSKSAVKLSVVKAFVEKKTKERTAA